MTWGQQYGRRYRTTFEYSRSHFIVQNGRSGALKRKFLLYKVSCVQYDMAGQADPDYNMDESDSDSSEAGERYYCEGCDASEVFEELQEALDCGWMDDGSGSGGLLCEDCYIRTKVNRINIYAGRDNTMRLVCEWKYGMIDTVQDLYDLLNRYGFNIQDNEVIKRSGYRHSSLPSYADPQRSLESYGINPHNDMWDFGYDQEVDNEEDDIVEGEIHFNIATLPDEIPTSVEEINKRLRDWQRRANDVRVQRLVTDGVMDGILPASADDTRRQILEYAVEPEHRHDHPVLEISRDIRHYLSQINGVKSPSVLIGSSNIRIYPLDRSGAGVIISGEQYEMFDRAKIYYGVPMTVEDIPYAFSPPLSPTVWPNIEERIGDFIGDIWISYRSNGIRISYRRIYAHILNAIQIQERRRVGEIVRRSGGRVNPTSLLRLPVPVFQRAINDPLFQWIFPTRLGFPEELRRQREEEVPVTIDSLMSDLDVSESPRKRRREPEAVDLVNRPAPQERERIRERIERRQPLTISRTLSSQERARLLRAAAAERRRGNRRRREPEDNGDDAKRQRQQELQELQLRF